MTLEPLTEADAQNAEAARITEWLGTPETKKCNMCKVDKPLSEFGKAIIYLTYKG